MGDNRQVVFYRTNWQIRAPKIRLIDESGKQIGICSMVEARKMAQETEKDLVEIAPRANPPVVKMISFDKFKYQQAKKWRDVKKKQKGGLKEIRMTPFIEEADLQVRLKKIKKFLEQNYRVKLVVRFLGRQITQKSFGYQLIEKIVEQIKDFGEKEAEPKLIVKQLIVNLKPIKVDRKNEQKMQA